MSLALTISLLAVLGFGAMLWLTGIGATALALLHETQAGVAAMTDRELDDDAKERAVRRAGLRLIGGAAGLAWRIALALGAAAAPILLADWLGLARLDTVLALMLRWDYILLVSLVAMGLGAGLRRVRGNRARDAKATGAAARYSAADRMVHNLAFSSPVVLRAAGWIEDRAVRAPEPGDAEAPILVTSLARGGTTALLAALHDVPGVATHLYRDMPFLTAPVLWNRLSGGQRRRVTRRQRAHGDGLEIDLETPEAFEEVLWQMHWPDKFGDSGITLFDTADRDPRAEAALRHHMARIVCARRLQGAPATRYCSKNNASISRLPFLAEAFPDARLVILLRQPVAHAASLLRQHRNFLDQQTRDPFVRRYMQDIGHFEFGHIHKPLLFPGMRSRAKDPGSPDYWLAYWIAAFRYVADHAETCQIVLQDDLRAAPGATMARLCAALDLNPGQTRFEGRFHSTADRADATPFDPGLRREAETLYARLAIRALA
ncbi:sulfotransferase [Lacimonas salitolerans]|uniref:Sulfotransferase n=1 Tax=Lacimonas salitolerans TaxID=1323750 RepID=A0ABW4EIN2_9RHOB